MCHINPCGCGKSTSDRKLNAVGFWRLFITARCGSCCAYKDCIYIYIHSINQSEDITGVSYRVTAWVSFQRLPHGLWWFNPAGQSKHNGTKSKPFSCCSVVRVVTHMRTN